MMAFQHFLTWRANQHGKARYKVMKALDPNHPVTVHAASPSPLWPGSMATYDHVLNRGNDWFFADDLDGIGCSSFPKWFNMDDADFAVRVEFVKSAARDKPVWLSEVQGGRSTIGFNIYAPVDARSQQRWVWNGIACGADTILFWCWRDEVFGRESGGFGISGYDGLAEERLEAMKVSSRIIEENKELLDKYEPTKPEIGVMFSPQSYYLNWAQEGNANRCMNGLLGYVKGLTRQSIPYIVVEEEHLNVLSDLEMLFLPRMIVSSPSVEDALTKFVRNGGTLVCESECGAFSPEGLYRYPEDRFTARLSGVAEVGRRNLNVPFIKAHISGEEIILGVTQWLTPWQKDKGKVLSENKDGALILEVPVGRGKMILCGSYFGDPYLKNWTPGFERFLDRIIRDAGLWPEVEVISPKSSRDSFVYVKWGRSEDRKIVFVFSSQSIDQVHLRFKKGFFTSPHIRDMISGGKVDIRETEKGQECVIEPLDWRINILVEE